MNTNRRAYHLPHGYNAFQSILRSYRFLSNPIKFVSESMNKFSGTYSVGTTRKNSLILTQDPAFINYVLKENHTNYYKSSITAEKAAKYFGKGFLFSNGEDWLVHRRLVQPGFHREKIQGLYQIIIDTIEKSLSTFPTGDNIDIYPLVYQLSFNIVINSLFTIDLSPATMTELSRTFTEVQDFYIKEINQPIRQLFYPFTHADKINFKKVKRMRAILKEILDIKLKIILGYAGSAEKKIAVERGELDGDCVSFSSVPKDWISGDKVRIISRGSTVTPPDMPADTPYIMDLTSDPDKKRLIKFLLSPSVVGRPYIASKAVPADRIAALQEAFSASLNDPQFLVEADKLQLPVIGSLTGREAAAYIAEMYKVGPELIAAARKITGE